MKKLKLVLFLLLSFMFIACGGGSAGENQSDGDKKSINSHPPIPPK